MFDPDLDGETDWKLIDLDAEARGALLPLHPLSPLTLPQTHTFFNSTSFIPNMSSVHKEITSTRRANHVSSELYLSQFHIILMIFEPHHPPLQITSFLPRSFPEKDQPPVTRYLLLIGPLTGDWMDPVAGIALSNSCKGRLCIRALCVR